MLELTDLRAALYPLRGVVYVFRNPSLCRPVFSFATKTMAITTGTLVVCCRFFYWPQYRLLSTYLGGGWPIKLMTAGLVAAESFFPVYWTFENRLHRLQNKVFDETLKLRGCAAIQPLSDLEQQQLQSVMQSRRALRAQKKKTDSLWVRMVLTPLRSHLAFTLMTMVSTALGPVGPLALAYLHGQSQALDLHEHYLNLKGLKTREQLEAVAQCVDLGYRSFGMTATLLNVIPILNWSLALTNSVGAAIWAADIERRKLPIIRVSRNRE